MYNQIYNNQSFLNTSVTISSISANVGTGFFFTSATNADRVAVEFNTNTILSAALITPALTAYNSATVNYTLSTAYFASISAVPAMSALSAAALSNKNNAFYTLTATTVTLTATITNSFSSFNFFNTDGTIFNQTSSGAGTILIDRSYIGDVVNFRTLKRHGFIGWINPATTTIVLTANYNQSYGLETARMINMGYI